MSILAFILTNLPTILSAVVGIENAVKNASGATKKQLVMQSLSIATAAGEKIPESHIQAISKVIDSTVATLNSSGIFTKTQPEVISGSVGNIATPTLIK